MQKLFINIPEKPTSQGPIGKCKKENPFVLFSQFCSRPVVLSAQEGIDQTGFSLSEPAKQSADSKAVLVLLYAQNAACLFPLSSVFI